MLEPRVSNNTAETAPTPKVTPAQVSSFLINFLFTNETNVNESKLKIGKITHQDVGQMDMYIRMYDDLKRKSGDNPTIGIVLCSKTDEDIARYSVLHDSKQIFMAKYMPYMPTQDELKLAIEQEKKNFYLQHPDLKIEYQKKNLPKSKGKTRSSKIKH